MRDIGRGQPAFSLGGHIALYTDQNSQYNSYSSCILLSIVRSIALSWTNNISVGLASLCNISLRSRFKKSLDVYGLEGLWLKKRLHLMFTNHTTTVTNWSTLLQKWSSVRVETNLIWRVVQFQKTPLDWDLFLFFWPTQAFLDNREIVQAMFFFTLKCIIS